MTRYVRTLRLSYRRSDLGYRAKAGADDQNRTGDLVLTKDALCQLSYIGLNSIHRPPSLRRFGATESARTVICQTSPPRVTPTVACPVRSLARGSSSVSEGWSGRRGSNPRPTAWKAVTLPLSYSRLRASRALPFGASAGKPRPPHPILRNPSTRPHRLSNTFVPSPPRTLGLPTAKPSTREPISRSEGWWGGEGSNLRSPKAAGLQPAAIDRSATSPKTRLSVRGVQDPAPGSALAGVIHEPLS